MASAFSHAVVALSLGVAFLPPPPRPSKSVRRLLITGVACAMLPDLDSIGFAHGIPYGAMLGHRGLSHSIVFAAALSILLIPLFFRNPSWRPHRIKVFAYLFLCTASHGLLDALTNGGLGVAFFSPFDPTRYFLPWQPIQVSPISIRRFFEGSGLAVMASELKWIWLPSGLFVVAAWALRRRFRSDATSA